MKIAILSFFSGEIERGVENWSHEFALRLSKNSKYRVVVCKNGPIFKGVSYEQFSTDLKIDWKRKNSQSGFARKLFLDYWSVLKLKFCLRLIPFLWRENFDVVIPTDGGWEPFIVRLITWLRGKKIVIVGHSGVGWDDGVNLMSFPDAFVSLSGYARKWAHSVNPFVRVVEINNGVDLEKFSTKGGKIDIPLKKPIVLSAASFTKDKRLELVIRAVTKIPGASLLIAGKGELEKELRELGNSLLKDRFLLKTFEYEQMSSVYRSSNLFVSASQPWQAFEMVITEAMASGLAVIANNDPIRREIVGDAGLLSDPGDEVKFAGAIKKALKTKWGDKPRRQAEKFSWDKIIKKYKDLFEGF